MHLALVLYRYFPHGGLQRDMLKIASACVQRGHRVSVLCSQWQGDSPAGVAVIRLPVSGWSNHTRMRRFAVAVQQWRGENSVHVCLGFNKMPGLDAYFAADSCYAEKRAQLPWWQRQLPRHRYYQSAEDAVFGLAANCLCLMLNQPQQQIFAKYYPAAHKRMQVLPPEVLADRVAGQDAAALRQEKRAELGLGEGQIALLALGSGFATKGLDRSIAAMAALPAAILPRCQLYVVGQDKPQRYRRQAQRLGLDRQVHFVGGQADVPAWLQAADVLLHPARREAGGYALLEAVVAGCPVVATSVCGFAPFVSRFAMGSVLAPPFVLADYVNAIVAVLQTDSTQWRARAVAAVASGELFGMTTAVVAALEQLAGEA